MSRIRQSGGSSRPCRGAHRRGGRRGAGGPRARAHGRARHGVRPGQDAGARLVERRDDPRPAHGDRAAGRTDVRGARAHGCLRRRPARVRGPLPALDRRDGAARQREVWLDVTADDAVEGSPRRRCRGRSRPARGVGRHPRAADQHDRRGRRRPVRPAPASRSEACTGPADWLDGAMGSTSRRDHRPTRRTGPGCSSDRAPSAASRPPRTTCRTSPTSSRRRRPRGRRCWAAVTRPTAHDPRSGRRWSTAATSATCTCSSPSACG